MDAAKAVLLLEFAKPVLQACAAILTFCVGLLAIGRPRTPALLLIAMACFVTVVVELIYLSGSLQTDWRITLFPVGVRQVLFLIAELLSIVEVFLWPVALILLIRERRASIPPTI
jgi:hypothetical protein